MKNYRTTACKMHFGKQEKTRTFVMSTVMSPERAHMQTSRSKSFKMCRNILNGGYCPFGDHCHFSHNVEDVQNNTCTSLGSLLLGYRQKQFVSCNNFRADGYCPYGEKCLFFHVPIDGEAHHLASQEVCQAFLTGICAKRSSDCPYVHSSNPMDINSKPVDACVYVFSLDADSTTLDMKELVKKYVPSATFVSDSDPTRSSFEIYASKLNNGKKAGKIHFNNTPQAYIFMQELNNDSTNKIGVKYSSTLPLICHVCDDDDDAKSDTTSVILQGLEEVENEVIEPDIEDDCVKSDTIPTEEAVSEEESVSVEKASAEPIKLTAAEITYILDCLQDMIKHGFQSSSASLEQFIMKKREEETSMS